MEALDSGAVAFPDFIKSLTSQIEQEQDLTVAGRGLSELLGSCVLANTKDRTKSSAESLHNHTKRASAA